MQLKLTGLTRRKQHYVGVCRDKDGQLVVGWLGGHFGPDGLQAQPVGLAGGNHFRLDPAN